MPNDPLIKNALLAALTGQPTMSTRLGRHSLLGEPPKPSQNSLAAYSLLGGLTTLQPKNALAELVSLPPNSLAGALGGQPNSLFAAPTLLNSGSVVQWRYVRGRFRTLLANLAISDEQRTDGETKQAGVRAALNRHYWNNSSATANSLLIGSWGKQTRIRPSHDIDILFLLPSSVYHQYQTRIGNRQSQLLQDVKNALSTTYSQTTMRGDGQVVLLPFNSIAVEVAPGFRCTDGSIIVCDTNDGGQYKTSTAEAEAAELATFDSRWNGNARSLARMAKRWQRERNVPLKSFQLERLAIEFLQRWSYSFYDLFWYDWMVRDFFAFIIGRANSHIVMPSTGEVVSLGDEWLSRAQTAYRKAITACDCERDNYEILAVEAWQEIFGSAVSVSTT